MAIRAALTKGDRSGPLKTLKLTGTGVKWHRASKVKLMEAFDWRHVDVDDLSEPPWHVLKEGVLQDMS